jgi:hypothetical protein
VAFLSSLRHLMALVGLIELLTVACRLGGGSVREGAFLQGVREAKVVLEQRLQIGAGRVLF